MVSHPASGARSIRRCCGPFGEARRRAGLDRGLPRGEIASPGGFDAPAGSAARQRHPREGEGGELRARGIAFRGAPHSIHRHPDGTEEWMAFFDDVDGSPLALMSRVAPAPRE